MDSTNSTEVVIFSTKTVSDRSSRSKSVRCSPHDTPDRGPQFSRIMSSAHWHRAFRQCVRPTSADGLHSTDGSHVQSEISVIVAANTSGWSQPIYARYTVITLSALINARMHKNPAGPVPVVFPSGWRILLTSSNLRPDHSAAAREWWLYERRAAGVNRVNLRQQ